MTVSVAAMNKRKQFVMPKNCILKPDELLEDFATVGDWTADTGSVANNTTQYKVGSNCVKLTTDSGATGSVTKTISMVGIDKYEFLEFWFYCHDTASAYASIDFYISSTADFSKSFSFTAKSATGYLGSWPISGIWFQFQMPISDMVNTGGESWANTMIRMRFVCTSSSGVINVSLDGLYGGYKRIPIVMLYSDDGYIKWYNNGAFQHMKLLGLRGDLFLTGGQLVAGAGSTMMSYAMIREIYKAGWNIANHVYNDYTAAKGMGDMSADDQEYNVGAMQMFNRYKLLCPGAERHCSYSGSGSIMNNLNSRTALTNAGALSCRGGYGAYYYAGRDSHSYFPPGDMMQYEATSMNAYTLAQAKALIDKTILRGQYLVMGWDTIDGASWTTANYKLLMNYLCEKVRTKEVYVVTVDEFYRLTLGPVTLGGFQPELESTWTLPANPVSHGFEDNALTYWDNKVDTGSFLTAAAGAALNGTNYGLNVAATSGTASRYIQKGFAIFTESAYCIRAYFDPNTITLDGTPVWIRTEEILTGYRGIAVYVTYGSSNYSLRLGAAPESGTVAWGTSFTITDAPHYIEIVLSRATTDGGTDGWAKIYVDGTEKDSKTGVANYNLFMLQNRLTIGGIGITTTTSGAYFIDEIVMNRTGALIGA
jgi:hypothetical protein